MSAVVPTRNRASILQKTLRSLAQQGAQPRELILVDASDDEETARLCNGGLSELRVPIIYVKAEVAGAASQRNQGVSVASQPVIWFFDDDILFEPGCVERLWAALQRDEAMGGVNAMIVNQQYAPPGRASRLLFRFLSGGPEQSYAGRCIGPGLNLLPEDRDDLPEVVPVEWLNTTCTLYRREALPHPPFPGHFAGYSLLEDVTLSLTVGRTWKLANARTARIYHDSQPGVHKGDVAEMARMELVNRHFVMAEVLGRRRLIDYIRLGVLQAFHLMNQIRTQEGRCRLPAFLRGKLRGLGEIIRMRKAAVAR